MSSVFGPMLAAAGMFLAIGLLGGAAVTDIITAVFLLLPGEREANRYGPPANTPGGAG